MGYAMSQLRRIERHYRWLKDPPQRQPTPDEYGAERESDVRFVVGTNADLRTAVESGRFREDLYYRINVLAVALPSLDERRDEIADWAAYMLERRHGEMPQPGKVVLSAEAADLLTRSSWPGNLRQLDNVLRRAYVLSLASEST